MFECARTQKKIVLALFDRNHTHTENPAKPGQYLCSCLLKPGLYGFLSHPDGKGVKKYAFTLDFCPLLDTPQWLKLALQAAEIWPILDIDKTSANVVLAAEFIRRCEAAHG